MARGADCEENGEATRTHPRANSDSERMIYFDNNATTQVDPAVLEVMLPFLQEQYGNPSSAYSFGKRTAKAVNTAREQVAALLRCDPAEIIFTSCGTESDNTAIQSALLLDPDRKHLVTSKVEHSAIIKHAEALARRGYEVTWLDVDSDGMLDLKALERAIREETAVVSLMWANNETGALFPIEEAAAICRSKGTLFHTDAVQAGGKESKRRGGTENTASIVALGKAAELAGAALREENSRVKALRDRFEQGLVDSVSCAQVNGHREYRLPNTSNLAIAGLDSEGMLLLLDQRGICCSAGSACTAGALEPSHVLKAMGYSNDRARGSLRFSFSRFNTEAEVDLSLQIIPTAIERLRSLTRGVLAA